MSRLAQRFSELKQAGRKALIPFITAGDPHPEVTPEIMHALVAAGADIIELGVPFSDPMADGPTIQLACERALKHGTSLADVLAIVREFRQTNQTTPVVLMGYLNPIEAMGLENFAQQAQQVGVDGVLAVDLSTDEANEFLPTLVKHGLDPINLVAPTTRPERLQKICDNGAGFIYYVSLKGVTGADEIPVEEIGEQLAKIRQHTDLPVAVGFGIRTAEIAAKVAQVADGVIVGSALVKEIARLGAQKQALLETVAATLGDMRQAMDQR